MLVIQSETSPTLSTGAFTETFGDFEVITDVVACMEGPRTSDYVFALVVTSATNVATITVYKMQASATNTWGVALTADVDGEVFTIFAEGY